MKPALSEREGFAAFVLRMRSLGLSDQRLMAAFEATSRMAFVSGNLGTLAYGDRMLPIDLKHLNRILSKLKESKCVSDAQRVNG